MYYTLVFEFYVLEKFYDGPLNMIGKFLTVTIYKKFYYVQ